MEPRRDHIFGKHGKEAAAVLPPNLLAVEGHGETHLRRCSHQIVGLDVINVRRQHLLQVLRRKRLKPRGASGGDL